MQLLHYRQFGVREAEIPLKEANPATRARKNSFGWLVTTLGNRMDAQMREKLAVLGLDLPSFGTLMTLFEAEGIRRNPTDVAWRDPTDVAWNERDGPRFRCVVVSWRAPAVAGEPSVFDGRV